VFGDLFWLLLFYLIVSDVAKVLSCNGKVLTRLTDLLLVPCNVPLFVRVFLMPEQLPHLPTKFQLRI
jgi:hypothetical protein